MMANDVTENLRAYLLTSTTIRRLIADRVHQNSVPQDREDTYIWLRLSGREYAHTFGDAAGTPPKSLYFDCECCSRDLDKSVNLSDAVRDLFPYSGAFGDSTVKGAFVNDQSEDYLSLNNMADEGVHVQAVQIEICP